MKNKVLQGTIILMGASIIAKIIGAIYRVPLINLIGTNGIGMFQLIFPIYALILVISCGGVPVALSKIISVEYERKNFANIKKIFNSSLLFMFIFSLVLSCVFVVLAKPISIIQGCDSMKLCYFAITPAIMLSCLISVFRGYFQGLQNMTPSGVVQILEQLFKLIFALLLAKLLIKNGMIYGVMGTFIGITISEFFSLLYCLIAFFGNKTSKMLLSTKGVASLTLNQSIILLIKTSFPIMLNVTIIPLTCAIESLTVVWLLSKAGISGDVALRIYGLEDGLVGSLINMPTVMAVAISTALVPNLTISFTSGNKEEVKNKCSNVLKYVWLLSLPCALIYFYCADKIIYFLYSSGLNSSRIDQFLVSTNLLRFSAINIIYISLLNAITAMLQACNKSFVPVRNLIFACFLKLFLNFIFVSNYNFNIYGIVITDIISFSLASILNLIYLKTETGLKLDLKRCFLNPLLGCCVMVVSLIALSNIFESFFSPKFLTLFSIGMSILVYIIVLIILKTFSKEELNFISLVKSKKRNGVE